MKYKVIVASPAAPTTTSGQDQTAAQTEIQQLLALKTLDESTKYDLEIADETQVQIGDSSAAELVRAIQTVLGKDASTTVLVPKKQEDSGIVTIFVECGKGTVTGHGEGKNKEKVKKGKEEGIEEKTVSGITGSFNSTELRGWREPKSCDFREVSFFGLGNKATDRAANKMDVLVGLNWLDFDSGRNLRVKALAERKNNNNSNNHNFKIMVQSWEDTIMYSAGCDWISLPHIFNSAAGIQHGSYHTLEDRPWYRPQNVSTRDVTFAREYTIEEGVPNVAIWFSALDIDKGNQMYHVRTWASNVTRKGFKINIVNHENVTLWTSGVTWLSYPSGKKAIDSAQFRIAKSLCGRSKSESGKIGFKGKNISYVFVGLNELEAGGSVNTRVKVKAKADKGGGVGWKVETWENSTVARAGGTVIVLEE